MKIITTKVLRGPNYWSNYRKKLIVLKIDLQEFEDYPSNKIPHFITNLLSLLPSLYHHECSYKRPGGFIERLNEGTWLGHVLEHVALELQTLAGMTVGFGRTRSADEKGVYYVIYSYLYEAAGLYAGKAAFDLVKSIAVQTTYENLEKDLIELKHIYRNERFGPSTEAIVKEALKRHIPYFRLDRDSLIQFGQGSHQRLIQGPVTSNTSLIGADLCSNKHFTKYLLHDAYIPIPRGFILRDIEELENAIHHLDFPLVIKPHNTNHGKGITTAIMNKQSAMIAFHNAIKFSDQIIVERFIQGDDYRFLVINYKFVAAGKREPAKVIGDGEKTIAELIDEVNLDPLRSEGHENILSKIEIDEITLSILNNKGLTLNSILPLGKTLYVKNAANISSGGIAMDATDNVHPSNVILMERIARLVHLDICGIDVVAQDISQPINELNGAIVEVNASPGLRMHLQPLKGQKRNVAKDIVDMLYPAGTPARIPIVAVTGTNGKTTVVTLIAYLASQMDYYVGHTTTDGIYINQQPITQGDCSGPSSAQMILKDPAVNFAVFECARGGILRSGLGFDKCNISIVTNISSDHLGLDDIHTLEDLTRVKEVVPRSTFDDGYAILNADDDRVYSMKNYLHCNVALFSLNHQNQRIAEHLKAGGLVAYVKNKAFFIQHYKNTYHLGNISMFPVTFNGTLRCMIQNILPAFLAGYIAGFPIVQMIQYLQAFKLDQQTLPGRMTIYKFKNFTVLLDYAHNENAYVELKYYLSQYEARKKVGIIAATGDRRPVDIIEIGYQAAQMFDEIIIRHDQDSRGSKNETLTNLLLAGIHRYNENLNVKVISNEFNAIQHAMESAVPETLIFYFPDNISLALEYLQSRKVHKFKQALEVEFNET